MQRSRKFLITGVLVPAAALTGASCYSCSTKRAVEREVAEARRDPGTNVIVGAEPLTLPVSATRACLLIHGWLGSRNDFNELPARLAAQGLTVRALLLPGHGTTPYDLEKVKADEFLQAVRREYRALREKYADVTVIGLSMGGTLATLLAAEEKPDRVVLAAPFFEVTYKWYQILPARAWSALIAPFARFVIRSESRVGTNRAELRPQILAYRGIPTAAVAELTALGDRARDPALLAKVAAPVLVLHAEKDHAAAYGAARAAFELLGSAQKKFVTLPRSNHLLFWDYDAEEAIAEIAEFVGRAR
jgi:carboxylesterase